MKTFFNHMSVKAIIFDVDGTFYPASFYIGVYYRFLLKAMKHFFRFDEEESRKALDAYGIYPYFDPHAASGTDFMINHGVDVEVWNDYRNRYYRLEDFSHTTIVSHKTLEALYERYDLFIISNNTPAIIADTLDQMQIDPSLFQRIYTSEDLTIQGRKQSKDYIYAIIQKDHHYQYGEMLGVGDRYAIDLEPLIHLGGQGLLVDGPEEIDFLLTLVSQET
ncbi:MAG: HAD family hydrolase [bacterium]